MDAAQIVRVKNNSDVDFVDRYDGRDFVIKALSSAHVPLGAVTVWLGNPTTTGADRQREIESLQTRYGLNGRESHWHDDLPDMEVYSQDDERIYFPADDPLNLGTYPSYGADVGPSVIDMAAQIADLQRRLTSQERGEHAPDTRPVARARKAPARSRSDEALAAIPEDDGGGTVTVG